MHITENKRRINRVVARQRARQDAQMDGLLSTITNAVKKVVNVVTAPAKAAVGITRAAITGHSIKGAAEKYVLQPTGRFLSSPGVIPAIRFIPGIGTAVASGASIAMALNKLRVAKAQAASDSAQAADIQKQIDANQAALDKLNNAPVTANAMVGATTAVNNAADSGDIASQISDQIPPSVTALDKKVPWGALTTAGVLALTMLK